MALGRETVEWEYASLQATSALNVWTGKRKEIHPMQFHPRFEELYRPVKRERDFTMEEIDNELGPIFDIMQEQYCNGRK